MFLVRSAAPSPGCRQCEQSSLQAATTPRLGRRFPRGTRPLRALVHPWRSRGSTPLPSHPEEEGLLRRTWSETELFPRVADRKGGGKRTWHETKQAENRTGGDRGPLTKFSSSGKHSCVQLAIYTLGNTKTTQRNQGAHHPRE